MRYETLKFILAHQKHFLYDNATTGGTDTTTDPGASNINPNKYLMPVIGGAGILQVLIIVVIIMGLIYYAKKV